MLFENRFFCRNLGLSFAMPSKSFFRYLKLVFLFWDLILLNITYLYSLILRYNDLKFVWVHERISLWFFANILWIVLISHFKAFKLIRVDRIEKLLSVLAKVIFVHLGLISLLILILKYEDISRLRLLYFYLIFSFLLVLFRVVFIKLIKYLRYIGYNSSQVIIVGCNENGEKLNAVISSDLTHGYKVLGFFDNIVPEKSYNYIGTIEKIEGFLQNNLIDEMFVTLNFDQAEIIDSLIKLGERYMVRVKFVPNFYSYTKARKVIVDFYGNMPVLTLRTEPLQLALNRIIKRVFDLIISILVIVLIFTWLFPILILIIRLSSSGPAFYKQIRSGEDNEPFVCYKFRSMKNTCGEFIQATKNDPRVTKIGRFIRKTNIDELPQVFNVLIGKMSIVGPRPHPLKLDEEYHQMIEKYLVRHFAKPGITGWAQVNGYRGETKELEDMQKRVDFDIWYIENWSFLLDLKIIWRTIVNMIRGDKNAY